MCSARAAKMLKEIPVATLPALPAAWTQGPQHRWKHKRRQPLRPPPQQMRGKPSPQQTRLRNRRKPTSPSKLLQAQPPAWLHPPSQQQPLMPKPLRQTQRNRSKPRVQQQAPLPRLKRPRFPRRSRLPRMPRSQNRVRPLPLRHPARKEQACPRGRTSRFSPSSDSRKSAFHALLTNYPP